mmetsp:Transcript_7238/g.11034  ORF Transcript_7238/g.11034 Transcript_7238/m.11034 type:complete len:280 (-) Transcript_7238:302-1141(-)
MGGYFEMSAEVRHRYFDVRKYLRRRPQTVQSASGHPAVQIIFVRKRDRCDFLSGGHGYRDEDTLLAHARVPEGPEAGREVEGSEPRHHQALRGRQARLAPQRKQNSGLHHQLQIECGRPVQAGRLRRRAPKFHQMSRDGHGQLRVTDEEFVLARRRGGPDTRRPVLQPRRVSHAAGTVRRGAEGLHVRTQNQRPVPEGAPEEGPVLRVARHEGEGAERFQVVDAQHDRRGRRLLQRGDLRGKYSDGRERDRDDRGGGTPGQAGATPEEEDIRGELQHVQ